MIDFICLFLQEMVVFRFHPKNGVDRLYNDRMYAKVFKLLHEKGRFGVLEKHSEAVKDCHLVPVAKNEPIPAQLLPLFGPGLEQNWRDVLLGVMWRNRSRVSPARDARLWTRDDGRARVSTSPIDMEAAFSLRDSIRPSAWHNDDNVHRHDPFFGRPNIDPHHHAKPRWSRDPHDKNPFQWYDPADGSETETGKY
jgi:hypothetical protein